MQDVLDIIVNLIASTIRVSTPLTLAAIGATVCERSGIVNIAMEGIMTVGSFAALAGAYLTGNPWIGLMVGVMAGALFSMIHGVATITLHMEHVVSGAVLNILAIGIVRLAMVLIFGHTGTTEIIKISLFDYRAQIPGLSDVPVLGPILFSQTPIVYMSLILVVVFAVLMKRTKFGVRLRASGEHPLALETIGVSVTRLRYTAVLISGITSGLAGAFLSIENTVSYTEGMTNGRGFIALAANISGGWTPIGSFLASLFFGFTEALQTRFQAWKIVQVPSEFFIIFPYVATIIAVAGLVRRSRAPKALGNDFMIEREDE
jgi:general nucleoside transport system permease protein